jgi:glycosyltransferase involved in cell wall biosynthesis
MISIIIPTKNESHNLPHLLKSIAKSKTKPKEIIIVDNHSTDKTLKVAKKILKNYTLNPIPYTLYSKGPERSSQKNFGAKKATGSHLLFLDADMELSKKLLNELTSLIRKNIKTSIILEQAVGHDFWGKAIALERNLYQKNKLIEAPRFIEKKLFLSVGGFDKKLIAGEDWDLSQRLKSEKINITRSKNKIIHHEPIGLKANLKRKWYYTNHINTYAQKHPKMFAKQQNLKFRIKIFLNNRAKLAKQPFHTLAFLSMKVLIYLRWKTR